MWNIDPIQIQAVLYIGRDIDRICTPKWDWQRRPKEEGKKERQ
jgi:hypothetical protein